MTVLWVLFGLFLTCLVIAMALGISDHKKYSAIVDILVLIGLIGIGCITVIAGLVLSLDAQTPCQKACGHNTIIACNDERVVCQTSQTTAVIKYIH